MTCMASANVEAIIKTRLRVSRRLSDRLSVILLHSFMMESILETKKDIFNWISIKYIFNNHFIPGT